MKHIRETVDVVVPAVARPAISPSSRPPVPAFTSVIETGTVPGGTVIFSVTR